MRGRRPNPLELSQEQRRVLTKIANNWNRPYCAVLRAKVLLAIHAGERIKVLAARLSISVISCWRIVQGFRRHGFKSLEPHPPVSKKPIGDLWADFVTPVPLPPEFDELRIDWG